MEQEKSKNNSSSSDDEKKVQVQGGRWYDCGFCKRGFTNAQALGGHMNIHRKDKDKALAKKKNKKNLEADDDSSFVRRGFLPHHQIQIGIGHVVYMPPPTPNHEYSFFPLLRPDHIHANQTLMHLQDHHQQQDLDLELRLGPLF